MHVTQSSGKSSVLEAVVLQLVKLEDESAVDYGEFGHNPGKKWFDFLQIQQEISDETDR